MSQHFEAIRMALDAERAWRAKAYGPTAIPRDRTRTKTAAPAKKAGALPHRDEGGQPAAHPVQGEPPPRRTSAPPREPVRVPEPAHPWYLRLPDQSVYGPVAPSALCQWAGEGRVAPTHEVSQDGRHWLPAGVVPELNAYWVDGPPDLAGASPHGGPEDNRVSPRPAPRAPDGRMGVDQNRPEAPPDRIHQPTIASAQQEAPDSPDDSLETPVFQKELQLIRNWDR